MQKTRIPSPSLADLPDELLFRILSFALKLPNGIHFQRWYSVKRLRFNPLLAMKCLRSVTPEALYKANKITIGFTNAASGFIETFIQYPSTTVSQWIR